MAGPFNSFDSVAALNPRDRSRLHDAWIDSPAVWRFVPKRGCPDHLAQWLGEQSPSDWHDIALNFDMACKDYAPLLFIAEQPNADRATIMSMVIDQDIAALENAHATRKTFDPRRAAPKTVALLDRIVEGFNQGFYATSRYRLRQNERVLGQTRTDLADIKTAPLWLLPERAWARLEGAEHRPSYVWDRSHSCQRLPFEDWVQLKLRPQ